MFSIIRWVLKGHLMAMGFSWKLGRVIWSCLAIYLEKIVSFLFCWLNSSHNNKKVWHCFPSFPQLSAFFSFSLVNFLDLTWLGILKPISLLMDNILMTSFYFLNCRTIFQCFICHTKVYTSTMGSYCFSVWAGCLKVVSYTLTIW